MNAQYGGTFTPTAQNSLNYSNGTITAVRVEDIYQAPVLTLAPAAIVPTNSNGSFDDQLWQANFKLASAEAIFGAFNQEFGYFDGAVGGSYTKLFNASGSQYSVTGSADISNLSGHLLRWARGGNNRVWSSRIADNSDGLDHMVTYNIQGLNNGFVTWLVMWEDLTTGDQFLDFDYNDLVVEIRALPVAVPEPVGLASVLVVGSVLGMRRKK